MKIEKLTYLEQKILATIAETHPYTFRDCEIVYRRCKSFDETIKIIKLACAYAVSTDSIMNKLCI